MSETAFVGLDHVSKVFPSGVVALEDASLSIEPGEFLAVLGPSGCGKSTLLRLLAGLDLPSSGRVLSPTGSVERHRIGYVFQSPTLMPWASVFDNVWLPLRLQGQSRDHASTAVHEALGQVGLDEFCEAFPSELSGGMQMRASIARALVTRPSLLLMDEPFAALDMMTRQRLNDDLLELWQRQRMSVVFVTHAIEEAVYLAQRVIVLSARPGRIVAECRIDEAYPRQSGFRRSSAYFGHCEKIAALLGEA